MSCCADNFPKNLTLSYKPDPWNMPVSSGLDTDRFAGTLGKKSLDQERY